ncbi:FAD-binding protein [Alicyclobacillus curvatus]|nr:FAD-binding protein [Alicyclobacillus curvatus]
MAIVYTKGGLALESESSTPLHAQLLELIPDPKRVTRGTSIIAAHSQDYSHHAPHRPDVVVFAESTEDVVKVMQFANQHYIAVTPCGVLTSLEGHAIPIHSGISLDVTLMNRVLDVRPQDFLVRVQPGVTRTQLNRELRRYGLQFPLDPGADASLGGMAATNASGTTAVRHGVMRDQVLDLEVVLADGSVIHTGGMSAKSSAGYNMTGLFIGSEGTLGVITELTLRVYPIPESTIAARAVFADLAAASAAAYGIMQSGIPIGRIELVDEHTIFAVNHAKGTTYMEKPTLFLEFEGSNAAVQEDVRIVEDICSEVDRGAGGSGSGGNPGSTASSASSANHGNGLIEFVFETEAEKRNLLWEARHDAALAVIQTAPQKRMKVTDVCVPLSDLPEAIRMARETIDSYGTYGAILGHVGDGNYHVIFMVDPNDAEELRIADEMNDKIVQYALARGGTCTGEHGVGIGKMRYLAKEHPDTLPWMKGIKQLFDPSGILNPGKLFAN